MAISVSGSCDPSSLSCATVSFIPIRLFPQLTEHLGGEDDTETTISDDLAVGVRDGNLVARLSGLSGNGDNSTRIVRYVISIRLNLDPATTRLTRHLDAVDGAYC